MKLKPYPKYKDSGINWLGMLPVSWNIKKVKHVTTCLDGKRIPLNSLERSEIPGDFPYWGANGIVDYINDYLFDEDLVLLGEDGAPFFEDYKPVAFSVRGKIWVNNHIHVLKPKGINSNYLTYCLNITDYSYFISGSTRDKLTQNDMSEIQLPFPTAEEQEAVVTYLDDATSRIDALIEKKERLIELLKEKRIALITQAVTKGLDPNVPMKDSGIEWLGEVPEHWEVKKLRYITTRIQTGCTPPTSVEEYYDSGTVDWFGPSSFKEALYLTEPVKLINQKAIDDGSARLFSKGTIMLIGIGATIGKIAQITQDASCNQQITAITMKARIVNSDYATYQLKLLEDIIRGIAPSATLAIFDQNKISDLSMAIPPIKEQNEIVDQLMLDIGHAEKLEIEVLSSISLLREYRSSLIHHAVTGKIDLRGYHAKTH